MQSKLFRAETARRIRERTQAIVEDYNASRPDWLSHYFRTPFHVTASAVDTVAVAVERGGFTWYTEYCRQYIASLLQQGVAPVAIMAAADLFYQCILRQLTADQRELVEPIIAAGVELRTAVLYECVMGDDPPTQLPTAQ